MLLHKRVTVWACFIVLVSCLFGYTPQQYENQNEGILYSITFDKNNVKVAKVSVSFIPQDSILYMSSGARNLEKRWATFVHNIKLTDESGNLIKVEELPNAQWKMQLSSTNRKVTLTYDLHLDHEAYKWSGGIDGVAYTTDKGVFYTGRALLILHGREWKNIHVEFNLPKDWQVTTPWNKVGASKRLFQVNTMTDLSNAMIFAGTHREIILHRNDFEVLFALGSDDIVLEEKKYRSLADGVMNYYTQLMGGIPEARSEMYFNKIVVVISSSKSTDGEVIGNNISVLVEKDGDELSKTTAKFIFAHEFFHLWNGKSFAPVNDDTEWFKEGFTNYFTLKALHSVGFLNDTSYLSFLNSLFYQKYHTDKGLGNLSMTNGASKHDHWGLIYGGGMFVGMSQDIIIRNATNNKKSIDDLMRTLFRKYKGTNEGYTLDELQATMSDLSGINQKKYFDTYIIGTTVLPLADYLKDAGFNAKTENGNLSITIPPNTKPKQRAIIQGIFGKINDN